MDHPRDRLWPGVVTRYHHPGIFWPSRLKLCYPTCFFLIISGLENFLKCYIAFKKIKPMLNKGQNFIAGQPCSYPSLRAVPGHLFAHLPTPTSYQQPPDRSSCVYPLTPVVLQTKILLMFSGEWTVVHLVLCRRRYPATVLPWTLPFSAFEKVAVHPSLVSSWAVTLQSIFRCFGGGDGWCCCFSFFVTVQSIMRYFCRGRGRCSPPCAAFFRARDPAVQLRGNRVGGRAVRWTWPHGEGPWEWNAVSSTHSFPTSIVLSRESACGSLVMAAHEDSSQAAGGFSREAFTGRSYRPPPLSLLLSHPTPTFPFPHPFLLQTSQPSTNLPL